MGRGPDAEEPLASNPEWGAVLGLPPFLRPASWGTTTDQIRAYYSDPLDMTKTELSPAFLHQLNRFSQDLGQSMQEQVDERSWFVKAIKSTGLTLSAALLAWLARGGALIPWLLSSLPAWRHFDPIPILGMDQKAKEAWRRRVNEADKLEAHDHQGLEHNLWGTGNEPPSASSEATPKSS